MTSDYRNKELQWVSKVFSSKTSKLNIGGQVPAGMKRWVTFLMVDTAGIKGSSWGYQSGKLYFASVAVAQATAPAIYAAANRKLLVDFVGSNTKGSGIAVGRTPGGRSHPPLRWPDKIDTNKPLFSIAGGAYLAAFGSLATYQVHMQYFDE